MSTRSKQLAAVAIGDTSGHDIYTVPAGFRTIVKSVIVQAAASAASRAVLEVKSGGSVLFAYGISLQAIGSDGESKLQLPWFVMEAGQTLTVSFNASGGWIIVSGAELVL